MRFQVTAEWDGHMWTAVVDGYPNVFTQAKRLDTIPSRLTEVLHLMAGIESDPGDFARTMDIRCGDLHLPGLRLGR